MPGDRGVEADLGLAESEAVLTELEIFFGRPVQPRCADRAGPAQGCGTAGPPLGPAQGARYVTGLHHALWLAGLSLPAAAGPFARADHG